MYTEALDINSTEKIIAALRADGYFVISQALSSEFLDRLEREIGDLSPEPNTNGFSPVIFYRQRYLTQVIAVSRSAYDLITSDFLRSIMRGYLGSRFRLVDQRAYATEPFHRMQWHVDNKFSDSSVSTYEGMVFIFYLNDVSYGQFQIIEGSHEWSKNYKVADFDDTFIKRRCSDKIVDFKLPRGSMLIFKTSLIHRAAEIPGGQMGRRSLLFQIEKKQTGGEPLYVNTAFVKNTSEEIACFLGFGAEPEYAVFPQSNIATMSRSQLMSAIAKFGHELGKSTLQIPRRLAKSLFLSPLKNRLKRR